MMAGLGNNPSFVWRSLLGAREIISKGSVWRIGDGRTTGVSTHYWLSHSSIFLNGAQDGLCVCDLINDNTRQWDRVKIFATFAQRTRDEILAFLLTNPNLPDTMFWKENKAKRFSVRTAYQVALRLQSHNRVEHLSTQLHRPTWNNLWTLNVPPKVRTFI